MLARARYDSNKQLFGVGEKVRNSLQPPPPPHPPPPPKYFLSELSLGIAYKCSSYVKNEKNKVYDAYIG